jgi:hypothetical protein
MRGDGNENQDREKIQNDKFTWHEGDVEWTKKQSRPRMDLRDLTRDQRATLRKRILAKLGRGQEES